MMLQPGDEVVQEVGDVEEHDSGAAIPGDTLHQPIVLGFIGDQADLPAKRRVGEENHHTLKDGEKLLWILSAHLFLECHFNADVSYFNQY